jgi:hypothetical protein
VAAAAAALILLPTPALSVPPQTSLAWDPASTHLDVLGDSAELSTVSVVALAKKVPSFPFTTALVSLGP